MIEQFIEDGIISAQNAYDLHYNTPDSHKVIFLDASFVLPTSEENIHDNYKAEHIEGALYFDIKAISNKKSDLPHMMPDQDVLEIAFSKLGITYDDFIIIYGQHGMIMGPARVWWTLKMFGHNRVAVLDGGYPAWKASGYPVVDTPSTITPSNYNSSTAISDMMCTMDHMISISDSSRYPIIDARPQARFNGTTPEPRAGMRSGHIPNSLNLPCSSLVTETGVFKTREEIASLFRNIGVNCLHNTPERIMTTCGSGITACALALGLHYIGYKDVCVYDGSWSEWGLESSGTKVV
ncbi:MAG: sulfurtransferase [Alphaproteobacteria bacterium]